MTHTTTDDSPAKMNRPRPTDAELRALIEADRPGRAILVTFMTGIPEATVRELARAGQIPHRRVGPRSPLFVPSEIREWFDAQKVAPLKTRARAGSAEDRRRATAR